jgi:hypothetical protein
LPERRALSIFGEISLRLIDQVPISGVGDQTGR